MEWEVVDEELNLLKNKRHEEEGGPGWLLPDIGPKDMEDKLGLQHCEFTSGKRVYHGDDFLGTFSEAGFHPSRKALEILQTL